MDNIFENENVYTEILDKFFIIIKFYNANQILSKTGTYEIEMAKHSKLPKDKRMWQYNMNALNEVRPLIDKLSTLYINTYHKKEYDELIKRISYQQDQLQKSLWCWKK